MQKKLLRDGLLGLFILGTVSSAIVGILWLRGKEFGRSGFKFTAQFPLADGLVEGAVVRYRGVPVGKVQRIYPKPNSVDVIISITDSSLVIPKNSSIRTLETGILGNTIVQIVPQEDLTGGTEFNPMSADCDREKVICNGDTVAGQPGPSFTALLQEGSDLLRKVREEKILENLSATIKSAGRAAQGVEKLTGQASSIIDAIRSPFDKLGETIESFGKTAESISDAAQQISKTAKSADSLIVENKQRLANTLDSISATAKETQKLIAGVRPLVDNGKFIDNLQALSEDAAKTARNLRQITDTANDPNTIVALRETIDSARATFANAQKITTDLNELTGDPKFRSDLRRLVNGLSNLVSTGNELIPATTVAQTRGDKLEVR
ncbi:MAG: MlaD family protein [Pseudanabaenaceae cyanobacterium SKYGB_i_bin29]|nr:MlaD family protein [Pseudanabaenaceae cyanobacterium SKYG29]MDW8421742.1 MlaD family protein [Pseudanabaenaceae cyanobacterium SKYGB_i_bin29]